MKAPDFNLRDQNNDLKTLNDYAGKWVVLYFYPKDDTPGCTTEACSFRDTRELIAQLGNAEIIGVSKDSVKSHAKFAKKHNLNFTLLSDESTKMIDAYGALKVKKLLGMKHTSIQRMTLIIDPTGEIVKTYPDVSPKDHAVEIIRDLKQLQS